MYVKTLSAFVDNNVTSVHVDFQDIRTMRDCVKEYVFSSHSWPKQITVRRRRAGLNRIGCSVDDVDLGFNNQQVLPAHAICTHSDHYNLQCVGLSSTYSTQPRGQRGLGGYWRRGSSTERGCWASEHSKEEGSSVGGHADMLWSAEGLVLPALFVFRCWARNFTLPLNSTLSNIHSVKIHSFHDVTSCDNKG